MPSCWNSRALKETRTRPLIPRPSAGKRRKLQSQHHRNSSLLNAAAEGEAVAAVMLRRDLLLLVLHHNKDGHKHTVRAVYEGVNELVGIGDIPLLREEGWTRHQ